jgi:hypothetical protein
MHIAILLLVIIGPPFGWSQYGLFSAP